MKRNSNSNCLFRGLITFSLIKQFTSPTFEITVIFGVGENFCFVDNSLKTYSVQEPARFFLNSRYFQSFFSRLTRTKSSCKLKCARMQTVESTRMPAVREKKLSEWGKSHQLQIYVGYMKRKMSKKSFMNELKSRKDDNKSFFELRKYLKFFYHLISIGDWSFVVCFCCRISSHAHVFLFFKFMNEKERHANLTNFFGSLVASSFLTTKMFDWIIQRRANDDWWKQSWVNKSGARISRNDDDNHHNLINQLKTSQLRRCRDEFRSSR